MTVRKLRLEPVENLPLEGELLMVRSFASSHLARRRRVWVYLPAGYGSNGKRYPVVYFQDGQNLFDPALSATGVHWSLGETIDEELRHVRITPFIAVGIANTGEHRIDEYAPTRTLKQSAGGGAALYGRLVLEELKPAIDTHFRTLPEQETTGVAGSSMGALVSIYMAFNWPGQIGMLCAMSPSLWWDRRYIPKMIRRVGFQPGLKIWLDSGGREGRGQLPDARRLERLLVSLGWQRDDNLRYVEAPEADHSEGSWAARLPEALRFLLPAVERREGVVSPTDHVESPNIW